MCARTVTKFLLALALALPLALPAQTTIPLNQIRSQAANTVIGNPTGSTAPLSAMAMPSCSTASSALIWTTSTGFGCNTISGGTVTSVGWTGGLVSVGTATTTPAFTVAGTSGGIPYFSGAATWASSAALTANLPVIGGGAGAAPAVGTVSGNTTEFVTTTGTQTSGHCVSIDANGNHIDAGAACGGSSSGGITTIASGSLPAATSQTITSIAATYNQLIVVVAGAKVSGAVGTMELQVSTNNGVSYDTTAGNYIGYDVTVGVLTDHPTDVGGLPGMLPGSSGVVVHAGSASFTIVIDGYQGGPNAQFHGSAVDNAATTWTVNGAYIGSTSAINALKIVNNSSNFSGGTYALYGVQ